MRIVVWILVGLGTLALILVLVAGLLFRSASQKTEDAKSFAANATQADCADETARRVKDCEDFGVSCMMDISLFVPGCMTSAKRSEGEEFCATVPAASDEKAVAAWREDFCPSRGLDKERCEFVVSLLAGVCGAAKPA